MKLKIQAKFLTFNYPVSHEIRTALYKLMRKNLHFKCIVKHWKKLWKN